MKKLFSVLISAIIVLALLLVPMTVAAESDYKLSSSKLVDGTNTYSMETGVQYTVFILEPSDIGEYTISTNDGLIGIVSYIDMWVQYEPTEENVNLNTIEWKCTDKNQGIMVAIIANSSTVSIDVSRKDLDTSDEIPWIIYENTAKVEKFELPSFVDVDAFDDGYVDFEDSQIDDAVLGDDGYYHLNDKNGPILFANLNDSIMSLYTIINYGKLSAVFYDENGKALEVVEYTDAFIEYLDALPTDANGNITSFYYPLTDDLIKMFKDIGNTNDWYSGDNPWVYESEDAWLFACYYDSDVISMDPADNETNVEDNDKEDSDVNDDTNNDGDIDNDDANDNTNDKDQNGNINADVSDKSPATGDNAIVFAIAILSVTALLFVGKKITQ